ncbi:MAG: GNAT family protein [Candidatus Babeliales bacterium]
MKINHYLIGLLLIANLAEASGFRLAPKPKVCNIFFNLPILETERLMLRPIEPEDAEDLLLIYADPEALQFTSVRARETFEEIYDCIEKYRERYFQGKPAPWAMILKETNTVIGLCGFIKWIPELSSAELTYLAARNYWDQGFAEEAKEAVITCAFEQMKLNRIESHVYGGDQISLEVNEILGFRIIGAIPEYGYYKGAYRDCIVLSLLKKDFDTMLQQREQKIAEKKEETA